MARHSHWRKTKTINALRWAFYLTRDFSRDYVKEMYKVPFSACEKKKNDAVAVIVDNAYANMFTPDGVCHRGCYYKMMWSSGEKVAGKLKECVDVYGGCPPALTL